jgi:hypothetical protein
MKEEVKDRGALIPWWTAMTLFEPRHWARLWRPSSGKWWLSYWNSYPLGCGTETYALWMADAGCAMIGVDESAAI